MVEGHWGHGKRRDLGRMQTCVGDVDDPRAPSSSRVVLGRVGMEKAEMHGGRQECRLQEPHVTLMSKLTLFLHYDCNFGKFPLRILKKELYFSLMFCKESKSEVRFQF